MKISNLNIAHMGPSKRRSILKVSDLNSFFSEGPKLSSSDLDDFEKNINLIRASTGEIKPNNFLDSLSHR